MGKEVEGRGQGTGWESRGGERRGDGPLIRRIARIYIDNTSEDFLLCDKPSRGTCRTSGHVTRVTLSGNTVRLATRITDDVMGGSSPSCWEASWARDEGQSPRSKGPRAGWGSWLGGSQSLPTR